MRRRATRSTTRASRSTLGGFAAAEGVYRSKNNVADIGSNYSKIPYDNSVLAHSDELRGTARQSRISFLAQGNINPDTGGLVLRRVRLPGRRRRRPTRTRATRTARASATSTARSTGTTPGWHLLAGQNWSLATMNGKGISPRNEIIPPTIEAQYVPGFVWARQPQIRLVKDFDDKQLWVGASLENPQTTFGGAAPPAPAARSAASPSTTPPPASRCSRMSTTSRSTTSPT